MSKEDAIVLKNIGMKFNLSKEKVDSLKDYVIQSLRHQIQYNEFWALKDINLTIRKGWHPRIEWCWEKYAIKSNCWSI